MRAVAGAAVLGGAAALVIGCSASDEAVADRVARELELDSARCAQSDSDFRCEAFTAGVKVLDECGVVASGSRRPRIHTISGCRRVGRQRLARRAWDDVEEAFAARGFRPRVTFGVGDVKASYAQRIEQRDARGGLLFAAIVFHGRGQAANHTSGSPRLARLLFGTLVDLARRSERRGGVARRGRLVLWYDHTLPARLRTQLLLGFADVPAGVT